jgi:hypothetical protein
MRRKRPGVWAGRAARLTFRAGVAAEAAAHRRPTVGWTARTTSVATAGHPAPAAAHSAGAAQVGVALCMISNLLSAAYTGLRRVCIACGHSHNQGRILSSNGPTLAAGVFATGHDQDPRGGGGGGGGWHGPDARRHGASAPGFGGPPAFHGGYGSERHGAPPPAAPGGGPLEAGRGRGFSMGRGRGVGRGAVLPAHVRPIHSALCCSRPLAHPRSGCPMHHLSKATPC